MRCFCEGKGAAAADDQHCDQAEGGDDERFRNLLMIAGARVKSARSRKAESTFPVKISLIDRTCSNW